MLEKALHTEVTALAKAHGQECTGKLRNVQVMESDCWREKHKKLTWKSKMWPVLNTHKKEGGHVES